ncbi:sigma E protease regulator RseP [Endothiovibrio diazotrophicus]
MSEFLSAAAAFLVAIGVLITVHEFGHFWVARKLGVKVLRFSIGFGRPLWRRNGRDGVEYVVAALPLGGYVKMLDEREGEVAPEELHLAFNRASVGRRIAIVCAGPLFNFLFAIAAYWAVLTIGVVGPKPLVGEIAADTPAAYAGLHAGDEIVSVAGRATPTWDVALAALLEAVLDAGETPLEVRDASGARRWRTIDLEAGAALAEGGELLKNLGIAPYRLKLEPVIDEVMADGAAAAAGLRPGDRVTAVDGLPVPDWDWWADYVKARPGVPLQVSVERGGASLTLTVTPREVQGGEGPVGRVGAAARIEPAQLEALRAELRYGPLEAFIPAVKKTWRMSLLTLRMLGKIVTGEASLDNVSGPISIARYAGQFAQAGAVAFLTFLAMISLTLGVLNLLPIPILDGGHLLYYLVEFAKGSPLSDQAQELGQRAGLAVLLALMGLAFYNDLARLFGG